MGKLPNKRTVWRISLAKCGWLSIRYGRAFAALAGAHAPVDLPLLSAVDTTLAEQVALGLSPGDHIMTHHCAGLHRRGIPGSAELAAQPHGARVCVAGLLVVHQSC